VYPITEFGFQQTLLRSCCKNNS